MSEAPAPAPPLPREVPGRVSSPAQKLTDDLRRFRLLEPAVYAWWHPLRAEADRSVLQLRVPDGFTHDFASVPRVLWTLISPLDLGLASIFHDWLYRNGGRVTTRRWMTTTGSWEDVEDPWTRVQADELFARMMREQGVPRWRRRAAYLAVRVAGRSYWRAELAASQVDSDVPLG